MSEHSVDSVRHGRNGEVWVGPSGRGVLVAREVQTGLAVERVVSAVRQRTPDEWWERAAAIVDAEIPASVGGPVGSGVEFFTWDAGELFDEETLAVIQEDAYEAAREVIVQGVEDHIRRIRPVIEAVAQIDGA